MAFKDRLVAFLKKYWVGLTCFFLSAAMSIYFYSSSRTSREPAFVEDPVKTIIIDSKSVSSSPLKVMTKDNVPIKGDVTSIRFYFWNRGRLSIKPENILQPILFTLSDSNSRILDYKILKSSRPDIIEPKLKVLSDLPGNSVQLTFNILEQNDGITGQIIYTGMPIAKLRIHGVIEGTKQINTAEAVGIFKMIRQAGKNIALTLLLLALGLIFIAVLDFLPGILKKRYPKIGYALDILGWVFVVAIALSFFYSIFSGTKKSIRTDMVSSVPKDVKP